MSDRWEYKTVLLKLGTFSKPEEHNRQMDEQLNQHGSVGWELVSCLMMGTRYRAIFKRRR